MPENNSSIKNALISLTNQETVSGVGIALLLPKCSDRENINQWSESTVIAISFD